MTRMSPGHHPDLQTDPDPPASRPPLPQPDRRPGGRVRVSPSSSPPPVWPALHDTVWGTCTLGNTGSHLQCGPSMGADTLLRCQTPGLYHEYKCDRIYGSHCSGRGQPGKKSNNFACGHDSSSKTNCIRLQTRHWATLNNIKREARVGWTSGWLPLCIRVEPIH